MNPAKQHTEGSRTISEVEEDTSCCIIQIDKPKLLKVSAGVQSCCIYRIPYTFFEAHETAYKPKIVSIGPYHHWDGKESKDGENHHHHLQMIQEHKHRYLEMFLSQTNKKGVSMADLRKVVSEQEEKIRDSYSEILKFNQKELINMMVLDGCFILTLFLVVSEKSWKNIHSNDPIFTLRWILPTLRCDLLLLENQVPLFILQDLLKTSKLLPPTTSLNSIIFEFFGYAIERTEEFWKGKRHLKARHLLDLIRKTFIPNQSHQTEEQSWTNMLCSSTCFNMLSPFKHEAQANTSTPQTPPPPPPPASPQPKEDDSRFLSLVVSARKLQIRGIKFKLKKKSETPLDITRNTTTKV